jgi:hypothetical protein
MPTGMSLPALVSRAQKSTTRASSTACLSKVSAQTRSVTTTATKATKNLRQYRKLDKACVWVIGTCEKDDGASIVPSANGMMSVGRIFKRASKSKQGNGQDWVIFSMFVADLMGSPSCATHLNLLRICQSIF